MERPGSRAAIAFGFAFVLAVAPGRARASAEFKADRDFLSSVLAKAPGVPFDEAGKYRGRVDSFRLVAIEPKARRIVVACKIEGEFDEAAIVAGLSKANAGTGAAPKPTASGGGKWRSFRFVATVAINVEPGPAGAPRFRFDVDQIRRERLEGVVGPIAKVMGKGFDAIVTAYAARKAASLDDKLNAEVLKKMTLFKEYGYLTAVDYEPSRVVLIFDQSPFRLEAIAGHVYPTPEPGTVAFGRWVDPRRGSHFYSTDPTGLDPRLLTAEGPACFVLARPAPGTKPLYRFRGKGECYYTTAPNMDAMRRAGYKFEGAACHVFTEPQPGTVPFFRFLDPRTGFHFYTTDPRAEFGR